MLDARKHPASAAETGAGSFVSRRTTNVRESRPSILDFVNTDGLSFRDRLASCIPGDELTDYKGNPEAIKGIIESEVETGRAVHPDEYDRQLDAGNVRAIGRPALEAAMQSAPTGGAIAQEARAAVQ